MFILLHQRLESTLRDQKMNDNKNDTWGIALLVAIGGTLLIVTWALIVRIVLHGTIL